uniref:Uncharacterized protein n=1 Tax=Sphaerodactylus townsendi TaxID=933632 RepID=A0ACB8EN03_9SAUR
MINIIFTNIYEERHPLPLPRSISPAAGSVQYCLQGNKTPPQPDWAERRGEEVHGGKSGRSIRTTVCLAVFCTLVYLQAEVGESYCDRSSNGWILTWFEISPIIYYWLWLGVSLVGRSVESLSVVPGEQVSLEASWSLLGSSILFFLSAILPSLVFHLLCFVFRGPSSVACYPLLPLCAVIEPFS